MPYTHFHDSSIHTHHQRRRGDRHHRVVNRRQRPWRIALIILLLGVALFVGLESTGQAVFSPAISTIKNQVFPDETQREERRQKKAAESAAKQDKHEREIGELANAERGRRNIYPLTWDTRLQEIARVHSVDMAEHGYFNHENRQGDGPSERAAKAGYRCPGSIYVGIAENIYFGGGPETAVESWLNSPGHRENMLDRTYKRVGVGVQEGWLSGSGGGYFTTMVLC